MNIFMFYFNFIWILAFVNAGTNVNEVEKVDCSQSRVELVVVMDASSSIKPDDFVAGKNFIAKLVDGFDIGPDKSRVGLVTFADDANVVFDFEKHNNKADVIEAIKEAKFLTGSTSMGSAIKLAGSAILPKARSGLPKILIVMTDGKNTRWPQPITVANELKKQEVVIIPIGVGDGYKESELMGISSIGTFFKVDTYSNLHTIIEKIENILCKVIVKIEVETCETPGDITFVAQPNKNNSDDQFRFISSIITRLEIGEQKQRASIVIDQVGILVRLNKFSNRDDLLKYLTDGTLPMDPQDANGLVMAGKLLAEDRPNVSKTVVLISSEDFDNPEDMKNAALALRRQGANVVTVAMGSEVDSKFLDQLSTVKKTVHVKNDKFQESYANEAAGVVCENLKKVFKECQSKQMDLMLVMDCSTSIGPSNWLRQLTFISRIVNMLDIGRNVTRVGVVYFNTKAFVGFDMNKFSDKFKIIEALMKLPFSEGATAIGEALNLANKDMKAKRRKDAVPVMILMTDGKSNIGVQPEKVALDIRNDGVNIITIGVTDQISRNQLTRISSYNQYHYITEFKELDTYPIERITKETCDATFNKPKKTCDDFVKATHAEL